MYSRFTSLNKFLKLQTVARKHEDGLIVYSKDEVANILSELFTEKVICVCVSVQNSMSLMVLICKTVDGCKIFPAKCALSARNTLKKNLKSYDDSYGIDTDDSE